MVDSPDTLVCAGPRLPLVILLLAAAVPSASTQQHVTQILSADEAGTPSLHDSWDVALSDDARFAAFASLSNTLVPGDTNNDWDIFRKDLVTGALVCVSRLPDGTTPKGDSTRPAISGDGARIAFSTTGTALVPDGSTSPDIVLWDAATGHQLVSVALDGSAAGGCEARPELSLDGRLVLFATAAQGLVAGTPPVGQSYIYLRDTLAGSTLLASATSAGGFPNRSCTAAEMSDDGRYVAFISDATDLVPEVPSFLYDNDAFVRDLVTGQVVRVSVSQAGDEFAWGVGQHLALSGDGRWVAFGSGQHGMIPGHPYAPKHLYVADAWTGALECVAWSDGGTHVPGGFEEYAFSADGRFLAFACNDASVVAGDLNGKSDVFVFDRQAGVPTCVSLTPAGQTGGNNSVRPRISADGRRIAFHGNANDLVPPGADHANFDVFVRHDGPFLPQGAALAGTHGKPALHASGTLEGGSANILQLADARESAPCLLFVSLAPAPLPFKGGLLQAAPPALAIWITTDPQGAFALPFDWPAGFPSGVVAMLQVALDDAAAVQGVALSNGLELLTP